VMTHSYVWHDSFICGTWLIHMCDMTHTYVWHNSYICGTWLIHTCYMTHSYAGHDSYIYVTGLIHVCDMNTYERVKSCISESCHVWMSHVSYECVVWNALTQSHKRHVTNSWPVTYVLLESVLYGVRESGSWEREGGGGETDGETERDIQIFYSQERDREEGGERVRERFLRGREEERKKERERRRGYETFHCSH